MLTSPTKRGGRTYSVLLWLAVLAACVPVPWAVKLLWGRWREPVVQAIGRWLGIA